MNEANPSPFASAGSVPIPPVNVIKEPPVRLARLLLGLAVGVVIFDLCFWEVDALGFSLAVFVLFLAGIILSNRESLNKTQTPLLMGLLAGAAFAAAVETGVANIFALLMLVFALAGETFFVDIELSWGRWLSQVIAFLFAPGRVFWLAGRLMKAAYGGGLSGAGGLIGRCLLVVPALFLALIFGSLLASGNAVFGSWTNSFFDWLWKELALYLDPARIAMWLFVAFLILPFLRPAQISSWWWEIVERLPRLPEIIPAPSAFFSSGLILVVLNVLFLVANIADAMFLWSGQALPAGVTDKTYVHEGVNTLIFTVILSAIVMTAIFQQELKVAKRKELKLLAYAWIVQNLFLMISVWEKLRRYIVTSEMTVARLSTIIFLILVAVGFILLTIKIARDRSITWLIGGCVLAVFGTFYTTQFMDLAGWSANYNVATMEKEKWRGFDTDTMMPWGPAIWPALRRAHEIDPTNAKITEAWNQAHRGTDYADRCGLDWQHWREFSLRAYLNRWALER